VITIPLRKHYTDVREDHKLVHAASYYTQSNGPSFTGSYNATPLRQLSIANRSVAENYLWREINENLYSP